MVAAFRAFIRLSRLKFLTGGILAGGLGTAIAAYAGNAVDWRTYALAQCTITALHLMTHYANDYFDREADRLTKPTAFSGGSGTLVDGSLAPRVALIAALVTMAAGLILSATLAISGHLVAALFGVAIAAGAWFYSAPPARLLATGWGELDATLVVAVCMPLCAYSAQAGTPSLLAMASVLPGAAAMFVLMLGVEYPDADADAATGKHNLVATYGRERARRGVFGALLAIVAGVGVALVAGAPRSLIAFECVALIPGILLVVQLRRGGWTTDRGNAAIAAQGVATFVVVHASALCSYAAAAAGIP